MEAVLILWRSVVLGDSTLADAILDRVIERNRFAVGIG